MQYLQNGATLLKHGRVGKPHDRFFFITEDCRFIMWKENEKSGGAKSGTPRAFVLITFTNCRGDIGAALR